MLVKIRRKIRCGIGAEGDDSSADLFYNLKKVFEKSNKMFYNEIEIIYNKIVKIVFLKARRIIWLYHTINYGN